MTPEELYADERLRRSVAVQSGKLHRRFSRNLERADIVQVMWVYVFEHAERIGGMLEEDSPHLGRELYDAALRVCITEKAAQEGWRPGDWYFYTPAQIRQVLVAWLTGIAEETDVPMWADVQRAFRSLDVEDQTVLVLYAVNEDYGDPADWLGVTVEAARSRLRRLCEKMQRFLGGTSPYPRRRALGNAHARAVTDVQW